MTSCCTRPALTWTAPTSPPAATNPHPAPARPVQRAMKAALPPPAAPKVVVGPRHRTGGPLSSTTRAATRGPTCLLRPASRPRRLRLCLHTRPPAGRPLRLRLDLAYRRSIPPTATSANSFPSASPVSRLASLAEDRRGVGRRRPGLPGLPGPHLAGGRFAHGRHPCRPR